MFGDVRIFYRQASAGCDVKDCGPRIGVGEFAPGDERDRKYLTRAFT